MDGMGVAHYLRRQGDQLDRHEGPSDKCPVPECAWPRVGGMVTITSGGRQVTGSLTLKRGNAVEVETPDGKKHKGSRVTAKRPEWGVYCPHGTKLIEAEPAERTCEPERGPDTGADPFLSAVRDQCQACHPQGRKIRPWPCLEVGCTESDFDREQREAEEAYYEEMRQSYYG